MSVDIEQLLADASAARLSGAARTASDELLIIDPETRQIAVPENFLLGVESDQNVERVRFQCPKVVGDNIDLSKLHIYVNYRNANQEVSSYWCQDVEVEGDNITFSWLVSRAATMYQGETIFIVCAKKSDEEGNLTNEWNTTIPEHGGIVLEGLEPDPRLEQQYPDVIEQILTELDTIKAGGGGGGSAANGIPPGGTTGQVLAKKTDNDYDVEWKTIDSIPVEEQYELVGTTPLFIDDGSWFVKPDVETIISNSESFSEGGIKNIAEDVSSYEQSSFVTSLNCEQTKNKIKLIDFEARSTIQPFYYIWFPTEVGKTYTFFATTDSGRKNQFVYGKIFPAKNISDISAIEPGGSGAYAQVDSGKAYTFSSTNLFAGFSYSPWNDIAEHTNTYYLFEGEYESIPAGGSNITLTIQPGEKKTLSAFSEGTLYANPETNVYKPKTETPSSKEVTICFGDSIMQLCKIPEYISKTYGVEMYNLGVSGATISYRGKSSIGNNAYDFVNIVNSLENSDLSEQISKGQNENFNTLLGLMAKASVLVVEYGTNDFQGMKSLTGEENSTIEGAYKYCLNKISQLYPYKKIIVLSTLGYTLAGSNNGNYDILQLKEKVKEICDTLHFPFIDMMTLSNITDSNKTVFLEDGVHPKNENGRKRYGDALYYALKTIIGV